MKVSTFVQAWLLKRVLTRLDHPRPPRRPRSRPVTVAESEPMAPPRGRLVAAMAAFLVVGMPAMFLFEAPATRVVGVLCVFGFIISGVFAIARPEFLDDRS